MIQQFQRTDLAAAHEAREFRRGKKSRVHDTCPVVVGSASHRRGAGDNPAPRRRLGKPVMPACTADEAQANGAANHQAIDLAKQDKITGARTNDPPDAISVFYRNETVARPRPLPARENRAGIGAGQINSR
jgi:hypothetical protein